MKKRIKVHNELIRAYDLWYDALAASTKGLNKNVKAKILKDRIKYGREVKDLIKLIENDIAKAEPPE